MKSCIQHLLALGALLCIAQTAVGQEPDTLWTRTFGGGASDRANAVQQTSDGGFVISGETFSFGAGRSDGWLIRTDADGDTLWTRTYGDADAHEDARSVRETADGGFIIAGSVFSAVSDAMLIRTDPNGNVVWSRNYGWLLADNAHDVVETSDGGFLLCGTTRSYHNGFGSSLWLVRTDAQGDSLWSKTYGGSSYQEGYAIERTQDDGFIVAGSYNNGGTQSADAWLLRIDAAGDTLWTRTYGEEGSQVAHTLLQMSDAGIALAVSTFPTFTLVRTDENGDSLWTKSFDALLGSSSSLDETSDGGIVIAASTMDGDMLLIRTDANGDQLWTKTLGGGSPEESKGVIETADGGFIVIGDTESYGAGSADAWMIRLGPETTTAISEDVVVPAHSFRLHQNYPNPFNPTTTIMYSVQEPGGVNLTIFNLLGQEVRTLVDAVQSAGEYSVSWDGRNGAGGFVGGGPYFYRMRVNDVVQTRSMLFLR